MSRWAQVIAVGCGFLLLPGVAVGHAGEARPSAEGTSPMLQSLAELRAAAARSGVRARMQPGEYRLAAAESRNFIEFSGSDSAFDLTGVTLRIDNGLFRKFGGTRGPGAMVCAISITGDRVTLRGGTLITVGDEPGLISRNKVINITGSDVTVREVDITTSGSSPWGYGSLFGISGGDVRKKNGIRVGWPARGVRLIGCRVHMRAMGHGIFIQGAQDTLIEDCHVDGLLRPTSDILAECNGYAFERQFYTRGRDYLEGVTIGPDGRILPGEMIALSEDGIRLYPQAGPGQPTGRTVIRHCTVTRMRRGICVGLGPGADRVENCEVRECVAAGFNLGRGDVAENCRADAKYAEALCLPYLNATGAAADVALLDSRGGLGNRLLAVINGESHRVTLRAARPEFVPAEMRVMVASREGYAFYVRSGPTARGCRVINDTPARVVLGPGAVDCVVEERGANQADRTR